MPDSFFTAVNVRALDGASILTIKNIRDANSLLIDWPHARRGPFYQKTREVVDAAVAGKATAEEAREAIVTFAAHAGVLQGIKSSG